MNETVFLLPDLMDTNLLLHYTRQDALYHRVEATYQLTVEGKVPLVSIVSVGEMRSLALQFGWGKSKIQQLDALLNRCAIVSLDFPEVVESYAVIDAYCRRIGRSIGENDAWIAATAKATGARLLTTDKDFDVLDPLYINREWIAPS